MKPAAVLLVAAAAWAQVPVETVALGTTAERPAVSQAVMTSKSSSTRGFRWSAATIRFSCLAWRAGSTSKASLW